MASSDSTSMSAYMRVSCAYAVRNGLTAQSAAQISPARRPNRLQPAHRPLGTASSAIATDSALGLGRAVAGGLHPDREQHVVERRRAVHAQHVRDVEQRLRRDPDRQPLVHPERLAERVRAQVERDREQPEQDQRGQHEAGRQRANARQGRMREATRPTRRS